MRLLIFLALYLLLLALIMEEKSPWNKYDQDWVFINVAKIMDINVDSDIPKPEILISESVDDKIYDSHCTFCDGTRINFYVPKSNEIWLRYESEVHVLAHEYVHYFQYHYKGITSEKDMSSDFVELEAVRIQNLFR